MSLFIFAANILGFGLSYLLNSELFLGLPFHSAFLRANHFESILEGSKRGYQGERVPGRKGRLILNTFM